MNRHPFAFIRIYLALTATIPLTAQVEASAMVRYTAEEIDLGFHPLAMNNRSWIAGLSFPIRPLRYRPGVGSEQISELEGVLNDINDAGAAVGYLRFEGRAEAIIRPAGAPWKRLASSGHPTSIAYSINESGQIVGFLRRAGVDRPFIYSEAEGLKLLFDDDPREGVAVGINESGQIAGFLRGPAGALTSFLRDDTEGFVDIGLRAGLDQDYHVAGIADNGTVFGTYTGRVATFSLASGFRKLGSLSGPNSIFPRAANARGWIVGSDEPPGGAENRAFLYVYGQGIRDLNSLVVTPLPKRLAEAIDINDRDEIIAALDDGRYYLLRRVRE